MPTKKKVSQKQKQRQSVVVNVNVAKARARASAKKSGAKSRGYGGGGGGGGGAGGSVSVQMPPQIYASPLDRLTPAMYGSQGQQIQQKSMDDLLRNFLSNQQNQQANTGFRSLGSEPQLRSKSEFIPYDDSSEKSFKSLGSAQSSYYPGSSSVSYNPSSASSLSSQFSDNVSEMTEDDYYEYGNFRSNKPITVDDIKKNNLPSPFQNEERSYLSASEPDYESTAPKFSQNESRVSQGNIYESIKNIEPAAIDRSSKHFYDMLNRMEEKTQKEINKLTPQIPEPFRRPDRRPPKRIELDDESILTGTPASKVNIIPFEDDMSSSTFSSDSLNTNPFPKNIYNKMMGFN